MHVDGWMGKSSCQPCRCSLPCCPGACARGTLAGGEWQYDAAARSWGRPEHGETWYPLNFGPKKRIVQEWK